MGAIVEVSSSGTLSGLLILAVLVGGVIFIILRMTGNRSTPDSTGRLRQTSWTPIWIAVGVVVLLALFWLLAAEAPHPGRIHEMPVTPPPLESTDGIPVAPPELDTKPGQECTRSESMTTLSLWLIVGVVALVVLLVLLLIGRDNSFSSARGLGHRMRKYSLFAVPVLIVAFFGLTFWSLSHHYDSARPPRMPQKAVKSVKRGAKPEDGQYRQVLVQWIVSRETPDGPVPILIREAVGKRKEPIRFEADDSVIGAYELELVVDAKSVSVEYLGMGRKGEFSSSWVSPTVFLERAGPSGSLAEPWWPWYEERVRSQIFIEAIGPHDEIVSEEIAPWWKKALSIYHNYSRPLIPERYDFNVYRGYLHPRSYDGAPVTDTDRVRTPSGILPVGLLLLLCVAVSRITPTRLAGLALGLLLCTLLVIVSDRIVLSQHIDRLDSDRPEVVYRAIRNIRENTFYRSTAREALARFFLARAKPNELRLHALAAMTHAVPQEERTLVKTAVEEGVQEDNPSISPICANLLQAMQEPNYYR